MSKQNVPPMNLELDKPDPKRTGLTVVAFVLPALLVVGMLFLLITIRSGLEGAVANLARLLPVGYAFAAGMVASVNPCGVLMLPTYVLRQLGGERREKPVPRRALRGLLIALVVTTGFAVIFGLAGGIIAAGGQWLVTVFPYAGLLVGAGMVGLGIWLLATHRTLGILAAGRVSIKPSRSVGNAFLFGIVYAVGSLSCTLPIFLAVVGSSLVGGNLLGALSQFLWYALGMGTVIVLVTMATALFQQTVTQGLQRMAGHVHHISAMFLVGAGAYLIYYWVFQAGLSF